MSTAQNNNTVKVHYTGKLTDGSVFDSSEGREPLEFQIGSGQMIKGFNDGVIGMALNESKTINIAAVDAYGERNPDMIQQVPREVLPAEIVPEIGLELMSSTPDGYQMRVLVIDVNETHFTVDANHFLAGQELIFDVKLVEIN